MHYDEPNVLTIIDYERDRVISVIIDEFTRDCTEDEKYFYAWLFEEAGITHENYDFHITRRRDYQEVRYRNIDDGLMKMGAIS